MPAWRGGGQGGLPWAFSPAFAGLVVVRRKEPILRHPRRHSTLAAAWPTARRRPTAAIRLCLRSPR